MKPEDITGIDSSTGGLVYIEGCTCDYNTVTDYWPVKGTSPLQVEYRVSYPVFRRDTHCLIHRNVD